MASASSLASFSDVTRRWFAGAFEAPTPAQEQGWEAISTGQHTLICAPTGSGKTLAAFLWSLDRLLTGPPPASGRLRTLYVSPLKALTYDVERNLRGPLAGIANEASRSGVSLPDIIVSTRTGDTPQEERRQLARKPPDILITTPESLYLLLTSQAGEALSSVETVIVDEVHAVAATKRGAHLALSLERLDLLVRRAGGPPPQRIGLSATQRPLSEVGRFLGGRSRDAAGSWAFRPVRIVDAGVRKQLELEVVVPVEDMGELGRRREVELDDLDFTLAGGTEPEVRSSIWPSIHPVLLDLVTSHRSTLVFVNSRRLAERLAAALNELARETGVLAEGAPDLVRAHHGSLAREQRLEIEDALKAGRLPGLVATSSLELGIDMGAIDLVVQVEAPPSVASGLQRIGRAGHQVGEPSRGRIFPKFRGDLVVAAVTAQRMVEGLIEETRVPRNPLDVLSQQVVAMCAAAELTGKGPTGSGGTPRSGALPIDEVEDVVLATYSFAELSHEAFEGVLDMLSGRYPSDEFAELRPRITWDRLAGTITARKGARMLAVTSGGTIPDRGLYRVVTPDGGKVGELDEEMVYESRVGETFLLGASTWRIEDIDRDRVVVTPAPGVPGKMPFWHGDNIGRPLELGRAVGAFLREITDLTDEQLHQRHGCDELAIANLRRYVGEELEATGVLPTDRQIVVERFRDELGDWRVCILSPFGARVHAPWALALEAKVHERLGVEVQAIWGDDGIVVRLPEADDAPPAEAILLDPDEVEDLVTDVVGKSAVFAARFRENAARALLLPRRRPGSRTPLWQQRQRAADLLKVASGYGSFPILLETYRECLRDVFDLPGLQGLMRDVRSRKLRVVQVDAPTPSPFAASVAFSYVASFIYEGDAPLAERRAQALTLDRRMLAELVGADELRELLDGDALAQLEAELQALDESRWARTVDEAHDLLRRLGDLTEAELAARSTGSFAAELLASRRAVIVRVAGEGRLIAVEDAGRYRDGLGAPLPAGIPDAFLEAVPDALTQLVRRWARTHGPFLTAEPAARFGVPADLVDVVVKELESAGTLAHGAFRPGGPADAREWCDQEVLSRLKQRSLALLRREVEAVEAPALARFLPAWHGVGSETPGLDRLYEAVAQLQGAALPASVLERDVLASRVGRYTPRLLDELLASGEVLWVGAGPLGRDDGRLVLLLRSDAHLLVPRLGLDQLERPGDDEHQRIREVLAQRGACFWRELAGRDDRTSLDALWDLVWAGEVTNDGLQALRSFIAGQRSSGANRSRRTGRPRLGSLTALGPPAAQGRWSLVRRDLGLESGAPPGATETLHKLAGALLERHGVLTREAVRGEGAPGGFAGVYPVLRALEEAGRIRRGYFVAGLGGAQFALPGAVDRLRSCRDAVADGQPEAVVLATTDPAQPYGLALPWPRVEGTRPQRLAGAWVVLVAGEAALYVEKGGKGLQALRPVDGTWEAGAVAAVTRFLLDGRRLSKLAVERVPAALIEVLVEQGFTPTPKGLVKYAG
jgi:ATP-dependent Lhr-like helicase